jgi:hypothetical protein
MSQNNDAASSCASSPLLEGPHMPPSAFKDRLAYPRLRAIDAILSQLTDPSSLLPIYPDFDSSSVTSATDAEAESNVSAAVAAPSEHALDNHPSKVNALDNISSKDNISVTSPPLSDGPLQLPPSTTTTTTDPLPPYPPHLHDIGEELYTLLSSIHTTNVAAWLYGPRGCGKSLLVHRTLQRLQPGLFQPTARNTTTPTTQFRLVYLHASLTPAQVLPTVVKEMIRQLTEAARAQLSAERWNDPYAYGRETSFTNQLQLLNTIFTLAQVDGTPIVLVLDDLECFVPAQSQTWNNKATTTTREGGAHLLLYYLLDRVATPGSLLSLVGLTSSAGWMKHLEKRVASRAEGSGKFLYMPAIASVEGWKDVIQFKMNTCDDALLCHEILSVFDSHATNAMTRRVYDTVVRNWQMGHSVGWLCRVLTLALTLYRYDYKNSKCNSTDSDHPCFTPNYWWDALLHMGDTAMVSDDGRRDMIVAKRARTQQEQPPIHVQAHCQVVSDLVGPQVALVLAARRILHRDTQKTHAAVVLLTVERLLHEYQSYKGSSHRYGKALLQRACYDLLDMGLLQPVRDHTGIGPMQYQGSVDIQSMEWNALLVLPLHLCVDVHRELDPANELSVLQCSTALREWGRKTN